MPLVLLLVSSSAGRQPGRRERPRAGAQRAGTRRRRAGDQAGDAAPNGGGRGRRRRRCWWSSRASGSRSATSRPRARASAWPAYERGSEFARRGDRRRAAQRARAPLVRDQHGPARRAAGDRARGRSDHPSRGIGDGAEAQSSSVDGLILAAGCGRGAGLHGRRPRPRRDALQARARERSPPDGRPPGARRLYITTRRWGEAQRELQRVLDERSRAIRPAGPCTTARVPGRCSPSSTRAEGSRPRPRNRPASSWGPEMAHDPRRSPGPGKAVDVRHALAGQRWPVQESSATRASGRGGARTPRGHRAAGEERRVLAPAAGLRGADDQRVRRREMTAVKRRAVADRLGEGSAQELVVEPLQPVPVDVMVGVVGRAGPRARRRWRSAAWR